MKHLGYLSSLVVLFVAPPAASAPPADRFHQDPSAASAFADSRKPPWFPDEVHVANGCHLSALAYVARFSAMFPQEQARIIVIPSVRGGSRPAHSIALVSWRSRWWGRDEYTGVFPLRLSTQAPLTSEQLEARARAAYRNHGASWFQRHLPASNDASKGRDYLHRFADVQAASRVVPYPAQVYSVSGDSGEIPVLFFRPEPGWIAVYDPQSGTAMAECHHPDPARIVRLVVRRLGYAVSEVRPHPAIAPESAFLVAGAPI